jgi:hypothetical protein
MKSKIRTRVMMALLGLGVLVLAFPVFTQEKQADMQIVREKLRADKKLLVSEAMKFTDAEAKGFWPVYESYQKELTGINDRTLKLIQEYAKNYPSMTNEVAKKLIDDYLAVEGDRLKVRHSYLPKFRKVLPDTKVARFYQLENKLQAVINYDLAAGIPMVE